MDTIFVGITPTTRAQAMAYTALNRDLQPVSLDTCSSEEIKSFLADQINAVVAISGPQQPNFGLMRRKQYRQSLDPPPRAGTWENARVVEYLLYQNKIRVPKTGDQAIDCPGWMQNSFDLFTKLIKSGYSLYPRPEEPRQILEINALAVFAVLLGRIPLAKSSLEGRLQRQLVLYDLGLDIPDPMRVFEEFTRYRLMQGTLELDGLYTTQELDALVAAYTAWMVTNQPKKTILIGDPEEGQISLPVKGLTKIYK